jgi:hypothetical protein
VLTPPLEPTPLADPRRLLVLRREVRDRVRERVRPSNGPRRPGDVDLGEVCRQLCLPAVGEAVDHEREAVGAEQPAPVDQAEVQVRCRRVAGVAEQAERLAGLDLVALVHAYRSRHHVAVERIDASPHADDDAVAPEVVEAAERRVVACTGARRDLRHVVSNPDEPASGGGHDRLAMSEPLTVLRAVALADAAAHLPDEVDREDLGGDEAAVGGEHERAVR